MYMTKSDRSGDGRRGSARRRTIGLLVDWLKDGYQNMVFAGAADAAQQHDVNLLCVAGGVLGAAGRAGAHRNLIYDFADRRLDGLVLMSGTLGNHVGPIRLARFCERFGAVPMTSVAVPLEGMPTVVVDDAEGMREAIRHLVDVHAYRRIAFVCGPEVNEEAQRRLAAYRDVLAERGIPYDDDLVAPGNFQAEAGAEAVRLILDQRRSSFEAIVAANDHMALGAMQALQERGKRIPQEVAVVGFDDVDEARFTIPPLTTVRQPLYQQGERALRMTLAQLAGETVPSIVQMKTDFVIRESCGCSSGRVHFRQRSGSVVAPETLDQWLPRNRDQLAAALARAVRSAGTAADDGWEGRLIDAFFDELGGQRGRFVSTFEQILQPVVAAGTDVGAWHSVITTMRQQMVPALLNEPDRWLDAEDLWQAGRVLIGDLAERAQARQRLRVDRWARTLSETAEALLATSHVTALIGGVAERLPRFGIETCFLALYEGEERPPAESRLVLAYDAAHGGTRHDLAQQRFSARELIPPGQWPVERRWTFIVEPLSFEAEQFGVALFEMGPREGIIYESLREQISSALNSARLVEQVVQEATRRQIAERQRLEKEMEIAAGIQASILPRNLVVDGLDIAATMLPASEVGGDYYDVFPVSDGCWIGIGDVAGHGLRTGLVMLMIQSGIGTLGRQSPHLRPAELLPFLNDLIFDNVHQRLANDEHATLTLLRYHRDGTIVFAGAHEDIIVCRERTGECEIVPTPGVWLGARRHIAAATIDSTLRLEHGDLIVLYTDGAMEAMSANHEQYGVERICGEVQRARHEPVATIRDRIVASVRRWMARQDDDITVMVARYQAPK
jgi:DNA-binding LacI/PurR family transcriptional regulator/serine phosphatase RsbU (regulator of sigma subunit)